MQRLLQSKFDNKKSVVRRSQLLSRPVEILQKNSAKTLTILCVENHGQEHASILNPTEIRQVSLIV